MAKGSSRSKDVSARSVALQAISLCLDKNQPIQESLDTVLKQSRLNSADIGLATELSYGYLRFKGRIDFLLRLYLRDPDKLPLQVLYLLGLGTYEIVFLSRIPNYASVNETVSLVSKTFNRSLANVANAVLRKIGDKAPQALSLDFFLKNAVTPDLAEAAFYSLPLWLYLHLKSHSSQALEFSPNFLLEPPLLGLRINPFHPEYKETLSVFSQHNDLIATHKNMLCFPLGTVEDLEKGLYDGRYSRQSFGSYTALQSLNPSTWSAPVWDACCGRGGKTCVLLESGMTDIIASDSNFRRLKGLWRELHRLNLPHIPLVAASAQEPPPFTSRPGGILLDVPCSGLGVLARRPDLKWKLTQQDLAAFIRIQRSMLKQAADSLQPDGHIGYITCTVNTEENEKQIQWAEQNLPVKMLAQHMTSSTSPGNEIFFSALLQKT